jgi:hypothetical protein
VTEQPPSAQPSPVEPTPPPPPPADPWSSPATIIEFGAPEAGPTPGDPTLASAAGPRRRRRTRILISIAAVVALLLGGAAFAGVRTWNGTGPQPEEAVPASVAAFARLDLRPGLGQGMKINDLLRKFPKNDGDEDAVEQLKQGLFEAIDINEADYRKHIKPWFADRFGVGVWLDSGKVPHVLAIVASDDDGAAAKGLAALQGERRAERWGFVVEDGWALVATGQDAQEAARDAAAEANTASLADAAEFRAALASLPARQPLVAWADLRATAAALTEAMRTGLSAIDDDELESVIGGGFPTEVPGLEDMTGRVILGAQATDNGIEVRMRASGLTGPAPAEPTGDVLSRLGDQPGNTALAAVAAFPEFDEDTLEALQPLLGGPVMLDEFPPEIAAELAKDPEFAQIQKQAEAMATAVRALSGATVGLAVTDVETPKLRAIAEVADGDLAASLVDALGLLGDEASVTRSGNRVELQTGGFAPEGKLADSATYRETLAGMLDGAAAAVYVDVQRLAELGGASEQERRDIAPVKSVGMVTGYDGGDAVAMLRIVIK